MFSRGSYFNIARMGIAARLVATLSFFIIMMSSAISYGVNSSADIPLDHWSYESIERLSLAGLVDISGLNTRPLTRLQMADMIGGAIEKIQQDRFEVHYMDTVRMERLQSILDDLIREYKDELAILGVDVALDNERPEKVGLFELDYNLTSPITSYKSYAKLDGIDETLLENRDGFRLKDGFNVRAGVHSRGNVGPFFSMSAYPVLSVSDDKTEVTFLELCAKMTVYNLEISAGRTPLWWGPGRHGTLLLSNNALPLDMVKVRNVLPYSMPWIFKEWGKWNTAFFVSRLEKGRIVSQPYFAGLRTEYSPLPYFTVGIARTSILRGKGRPRPSLGDYWKIFVAKSRDEFTTGEPKATDTDQLASLDFKLCLPWGDRTSPMATDIEIYGEWAGEDKFWFTENESPGLLVGAYLPDIFKFKGIDLCMEYAKTKSAWYTHGIYQSGYRNRGLIMGHHMGTDADDISLSISKYFEDFDALLRLQYSRERRGLSLGYPEIEDEITLDLFYRFADRVDLKMSYELENIQDYGNIVNNDKKNHLFSLETDIKF
ncbi:MAG: hypothetical protein HQ593_01990 [Candidatus Omnitrophica bacterium]|nr:hypothetical protein [Candidatus Omnitrophota bacterium]